jgi:hypothetical protein
MDRKTEICARYPAAASLAAILLTAAGTFGATPAILPSAQSFPVKALESVDRLEVSVLDRSAVALEDEERERQGLAPRYAIPNEVSVTPSMAGTWEDIGDDTSLWRLRITSPGATSLNLGFGHYRMPEGGRLMFYAADMSYVLRPFTADDNEDHGELWTPIVTSDDAVVEVTVPTGAIPELDLEITFVNVGYQGFETLLSRTPGSCNIDVVCPQGDAWRADIRSVSVISTGGSLFCTGFMVNNTSHDATPYFMTANHCGINSGNAASLVVYWNYESPICGQLGGGSLSDYQTGSYYRAAYSTSDFTLVELDSDPDPSWDVAFAGWDRSGANATSAVAIHQPDADVKCISFENHATQTTSYMGTSPPGDGTHVRVVDWDLGTTEPGSSGSPLFDQNHHVIGQLHGGNAACGNDESDWYGRFSVSWTGGGTSSTRLSDWLDPGATGESSVDALDPNIFIVNSDGTGDYPTIQAAIDAAGDGAIIELADGTFTGPGNRDIDFLGKAITVRSQSGSPELCVIDCEGGPSNEHRGFVFHTAAESSAVLANITVTNGYRRSGSFPAIGGGGILCYNSGPRIEGCILMNNTACIGGGILGYVQYGAGSLPTVDYCTFLLNNAVGDGGSWRGDGGGIYFDNGPGFTLTNCVFEENTAAGFGSGGGLYANVAGVPGCHIAACAFIDNAAYADASALALWGSHTYNLDDCTIEGNAGSSAVFVYGNGGPIECNMTHCVISANRDGWGVWGYADATIRLSGCTLVGNGGGALAASSGCTVFADNTIAASSTAHEGVACQGAGYATLSCCDVYGNAGGDWVGCIADQYGVDGNFSANPLFCDLDNGNYHISDASPCAAGHSPSDCGLVGALGVGCGAVACGDYGDPGNPPVMIGGVETVDCAFGVAVAGSYAYVADLSGDLLVIDISNPQSPRIRGSVHTPGSAYAVAMSEIYACVAAGTGGLQVVDVSNPMSPQIVGSVDTPGPAYGVAVVGTHAYVATWNSGLQVIDISIPATPQIVAAVVTPGSANGVAASGTCAYVAAYHGGLQIVDVSNPASPRVVGGVDTPDRAVEVAVAGAYAYVADYTSGLQVVDVSDPASPHITGNLPTPGASAYGVDVGSGYVYVTDVYSDIQIVDVSDPASPLRVGGVPLPPNPQNVVLAYPLLCLANGSSGLQIAPAQCDPLSAAPEDDRIWPGLSIRLFPNPSSGHSIIQLHGSVCDSARAKIYDPTGRLVRSLPHGTLTAGAREFSWDGRDESGRMVSSGMYSVRVRSAEGVRTGRLLFLR